MSGIIEQIQRDALDPNFPVSALLRKVKLAAAKLKLPKVEDWVDSELKGYTDEVPKYRNVRGLPKARNPFHGWIAIGGDAATIDFISTLPAGQAISGIESLLSQKESSRLMFPYPPNLVEELNKGNGVFFPEMGLHVDRSAAVAIVDAVRTLVLEWAIELEKSGITGSDVGFSPDEQQIAQKLGVNIEIGSIHSFTGNLGAQGVSGDVIVTNIKAESVRDFITQVKQQTEQLAREGVDRKELHRIIRAIEEGLDAKKPISVISQLLEELKGVVVKVGAKLVSTGVLAMLNQLLSTGIPTV